MMNAAQSGRFRIGGAFEVNRLGFGAMRIVGKGIWGPPEDRAEALRTLNRLPELGVDFIDTADSYGPDVSEELIREALHPYRRDPSSPPKAAGAHRPEQLDRRSAGPNISSSRRIRAAGGSASRRSSCGNCTASTRRCRAGEQFDAIKTLLKDEVIRARACREVSVEEIEAASKVFPVATVQNRYNLADRASEAVLDYCEKHGIGFIPWFPLSCRRTARATARRSTRLPASTSATPGQIALAWL